MKLLSVINILLLFLTGCSSSIESTKKQAVPSPSKEIKINNLKIIIPAGWKKIDDNSEQLFQIWLVNDENNASIGFRNIYLNNFSDQKLDDKLKIIEQLMLNKRKSNYGSFELLSRSAGRVNNLDIVELRFLLEDKIQNLIIFTNGKDFYECLAYFKNDYEPSTPEIEVLLDKQKKLIEGLTIYNTV